MSRRASMLSAVLLMLAAGLRGDGPTGPVIPPPQRVEAKVAAHLAGPKEQPLRMPTDVAVDSTGRVHVADGVNNRVVSFAPDGRVANIVQTARGESLSRPTGIAVDAKDRLWIADTGNARLVVTEPDGKLVQTIPLPQGAGDHPPDATDLLVSPDGKQTFVVDNDNHRLLVRDNASGQWSTLGRRGQALGQFEYPFMICLGREQALYVTEAIGARVQRITAAGRWGGSIGRWGVRLGRLQRPKGVAADHAGRLYVSDSTLGVVQVFGPRGKVLGVLADGEGRPLRFAHPMGLGFAPDGRLYVVELRADRVAVVEVPQAKPPPTTQPDDERKGGDS